MKKTTMAVVCFLFGGVAGAQNIGDQATAGYTSSRTYLNSDQGDFAPPLTRVRTIDLEGVTNAGSLLVFQNNGARRLLVGEASATEVRYRLVDVETGAPQWTQTLPGSPGALNYVPAYANDVVLLGGAATTAVAAVQVSTGMRLWQDNSVGETSGRYPVLTEGLALYQGRNLIRATDPDSGPGGIFWQLATTTAQAPVSVFGQRAYVLEEAGNLRSLDLATGQTTWTVSNVPGVNPNIIATERYVFINSSDTGVMGALSVNSPGVIWARATDTLSQTPATALAYDRLYVFTSSDADGNGRVTALNPDTGAVLWERREPGAGIDYGFVANNVVYYYHQATGRIRARDAFTGTLAGTLRRDGVRGLSASDGQLYVLLASQVEVVRGGGVLYFAHLADGGGQQTLLTLTNNNPDAPATGRAFFFGTDGMPLALALQNAGVATEVNFVIAPGGSIGLQSLGAPSPRAGWVRVVADQPLSGSEIFQFVDDVTGLVRFEAGVGDSPATGVARTFVELFFPPERPATLSTGIAVANVSGVESTEVVATLTDPLGTMLGEERFTLPPRGQSARFLQQLFEMETFSGFRGTLTVRSELPVVVTALRTQGGFQLSSVPVGN